MVTNSESPPNIWKLKTNAPFLSLEIDGEIYQCLVDTGASKSLINTPSLKSSGIGENVIGISGKPTRVCKSEPVRVRLGPVKCTHDFLMMPGSPACLLGRDLLGKLGASIVCTPEGLEVALTAGTLLAFLEETQEAQGTPFTIPELKEIPPEYWAETSESVGKLKSAVPVKIKVHPDMFPPRQKQYPLSQEAEQALDKIIAQLLKQGILVKCSSPCNTPVMAVKKKGVPGEPPTFRMVQDLRSINRYVIPRHNVVPNPATIISSIPSSSQIYTVIDLSSAFFSIPVDPESQYLFAFTWKNRVQYTFTRLSQGYVESPTLFTQILHQDLEDIALPEKSVLVIYVDDLLICSGTREQCLKDSIYLIKRLGEKGHKIAKRKLQWCSPQVEYLGHTLVQGNRKLSAKRVQTILQLKPPCTKSQVRALLGILGYCRPWIPSFADITRPWVEKTGKNEPEVNEWTGTDQAAWGKIKRLLISAPALGLPDYEKVFLLYVHERNGTAAGVLCQWLGPARRPVGYYSGQLDPVARGMVPCLRSVAAAALILEKVQDLVLGHKLQLWVPHAVAALLLQKNTQHFSNARYTQYETALLQASNVEILRCNTLNPATLLPEVDSEEPHDCEIVVQELQLPRSDLTDIPLQNPDYVWFVDGSSRVIEGKRFTGYAVVSLHGLIEAEPLPSNKSAQAAELTALTRACELAKGRRLTLYTDSKYGFGICHSTGALWAERGFLTAAGKPIANGPEISALLSAIQQPAALAVVHCRAHTRENTEIARGNDRADHAAKVAAQKPLLLSMLQSSEEVDYPLSGWWEDCSNEEKRVWLEAGAIQSEMGDWTMPDGRLILPKKGLRIVLTREHQTGHGGETGLAGKVSRVWFAPGVYQEAKRVVRDCEVCSKQNAKRAPPGPKGGRPWVQLPFESLQIDFAKMPPTRGFKWMLVITDKLSGWVEAFPCRQATASQVGKCLLRDIVPRFGTPNWIYSDRGSHFTGEIIQYLAKMLGVNWRLHTPYHPQSAGQVERMNATLKGKLVKLCQTAGLDWVQGLPLALYSVRTSPRRSSGLSPYEALFGRPPPVGRDVARPHVSLLGGDEALTSYLLQLQKHFASVRRYLGDLQPLPLEVPAHPFVPGDQVYVKKFPVASLGLSWTGPHLVLLTTHTALKVQGRSAWIHYTHCAKHLPTNASPATDPADEGGPEAEAEEEPDLPLNSDDWDLSPVEGLKFLFKRKT